MKIKCLNSRCKEVFSIKHSKCPKCNRAAGPVDFVKHHAKNRWYKLWGGKKRVFKADCPACSEPFPLDATQCPHCKTSVTLFPLFLDVARPYLRLVDAIKNKFENLSPTQAILLRISYFVASIFIVFLLVNKIEDEVNKGNMGKMIIAAFASVFYIGVSLLALSWLLPADIGILVKRLRPMFKISLAINYLSLVLALVLITDRWSTKAWILIGTFFISIVATWFSVNFVVPSWFNAASILSGTYGAPEPDPNKRGRTSTHRPNIL